MQLDSIFNNGIIDILFHVWIEHLAQISKNRNYLQV